jgi:formylglycine-generating enzyme required for sulfatase activity
LRSREGGVEMSDELSERLKAIADAANQSKPEMPSSLGEHRSSWFDLEQQHRANVSRSWLETLSYVQQLPTQREKFIRAFIDAFGSEKACTIERDGRERKLLLFEPDLARHYLSPPGIPRPLLAAYLVYAKRMVLESGKGARARKFEKELAINEQLLHQAEQKRERAKRNTQIAEEEKKQALNAHAASVKQAESEFGFFERVSSPYRQMVAEKAEEERTIIRIHDEKILSLHVDFESADVEVLLLKEEVRNQQRTLNSIQADPERRTIQTWTNPLEIQEPSQGILEHGCVPAGTIHRGDSERRDEQPWRHLHLSEPMKVLSTAVTQALYLVVLGYNPSSRVDLLRPVERVSWFDAIHFCNELSLIFGFEKPYRLDTRTRTVVWKPEAKGFRLPTEAEWEAAARGGQSLRFAGSDSPDKYAWTTQNSRNKSQRVGRLRPNSMGLYDMSGNVWEWCWDWYSANYYDESPKDDPKGPEMGTKRVIRGGSACSPANNCRCSHRSSMPPRRYDGLVGFRVVWNS